VAKKQPKGNKQDKRATRAERRAEKKAQEEADQTARAEKAMRMRQILAGIAVVTLAGAAIAHFGFDSAKTAALIVVIGIVIFAPLGLSTLASDVAPRDRIRAGSIDFGKNEKKK
jgi:ABC-type transport system involved in cytochrome bd biosynthesis fused ATPase/permease subunit